MPGEGRDRSVNPGILPEGDERMGALIWFLFIAAVIAVLERETFFS